MNKARAFLSLFLALSACSPNGKTQAGVPKPAVPAPAAPAQAAPGPAAPQTSVPPPSQPGAKMESKWMELSLGESRFLVVKVAEPGKVLPGDHEGKAAFLARAKVPKSKPMLVYIIVPNALKDSRFSLKGAAGEKALPEPRMIFRMPGSALYAAAVVDSENPGSVTVARAGKPLGALGLDARALRDLPLFWNGDPADGVAFDDLPAWLEGSGP